MGLKLWLVGSNCLAHTISTGLQVESNTVRVTGWGTDHSCRCFRLDFGIGSKISIHLYHLESRWRNSHVLVYHGPLQIATFWELRHLLSLRCKGVGFTPWNYFYMLMKLQPKILVLALLFFYFWFKGQAGGQLSLGIHIKFLNKKRICKYGDTKQKMNQKKNLRLFDLRIILYNVNWFTKHWRKTAFSWKQGDY